MNPISGWLCTSSSKNMFVKVVHPGGHVELHDRPILVAELLSRNPKCCVAHPTVFRQPYDVLSPTTTLALGHKYYVVPIATVRRLQLNYSPSSQEKQSSIQTNDIEKDKEMGSGCLLIRHSQKGSGNKIKTRSVIKSSKYCDKAKDTRDNDHKGFVGLGNGSGERFSLKSLDNWQPGLDSITE